MYYVSLQRLETRSWLQRRSLVEFVQTRRPSLIARTDENIENPPREPPEKTQQPPGARPQEGTTFDFDVLFTRPNGRSTMARLSEIQPHVYPVDMMSQLQNQKQLNAKQTRIIAVIPPLIISHLWQT